MSDLGFIHRFVPATQPDLPPLLLLHGTGGDENDLIQLGQELSPGAAPVVAARQGLENGMPRFFHRRAAGRIRTKPRSRRVLRSLPGSIAAARKAYDLEAPVAVGFSNGANIAVSLLLTQPDVLRGAVLLRAMVTFEQQVLPNLAAKPVLLLSGDSDTMMIPAAAGTSGTSTILQAAGCGIGL